jgi:hypothetical protein
MMVFLSFAFVGEAKCLYYIPENGNSSIANQESAVPPEAGRQKKRG